MVVNNQFLEGIVLSMIAEQEEGIYPYAINMMLEEQMKISETTIYGVCNRLMKNGYIHKSQNTQIVNGRARSYYTISGTGVEKLKLLKQAYGKERNLMERWLGK